MNVLDLFSGIGGFSLGLERAGMRTVAFCEIEPFCRAVLKKHWPQVPCYTDVTELTADRLRADGISVDAICGGFPCQDISVAGKRVGIGGERSGLWKEYARIIGELRPRYVIVENVAALLNRGLDVVLGDLAEIGYDAEWHCIPASAVGAPHRRDRLWLVAYPAGANAGGHQDKSQGAKSSNRQPAQLLSDTSGRCRGDEAWRHYEDAVADPNGDHEHWRCRAVQMGWGWRASQIANDGDGGRAQWSVEPGVGRVAHGVSARVDRLCGLGNAVVPQIPEIIGRAILAHEASHSKDRTMTARKVLKNTNLS